MLARLHAHLTYANVTATLALFVALGGSSYAALNFPKNSIGTRQLKKGSVTAAKVANNAINGAKVKDGSLSGADIVAGSLGKVSSAGAADSATNATNASNANHALNADHASNADELGGQAPGSYRLQCPASLSLAAGLCYETSARSATDFFTALEICADAGRRLPSAAELAAYERTLAVEPPKEWTDSLYYADASGVPGDRGMLWSFSKTSGHAGGGESFTNADPFRCIASPSN
jgi:hypothetical protein